MKTHFALLALLVAGLAPARTAEAGSADDAAIRQLETRFAITASTYLERGWELHDASVSFIETGDHIQARVWLDAGDEIVFRGMGDADALDLDLAVFGPNGNLVANDTDFDATPLVTFNVRRSGFYTVRFGVVDCRTNGSYCILLMAQK